MTNRPGLSGNTAVGLSDFGQKTERFYRLLVGEPSDAASFRGPAEISDFLNVRQQS